MLAPSLGPPGGPAVDYTGGQPALGTGSVGPVDVDGSDGVLTSVGGWPKDLSGASMASSAMWITFPVIKDGTVGELAIAEFTDMGTVPDGSVYDVATATSTAAH